MLLCSKKRSAGVTIDCLMQRHHCWLHNWQMSVKKGFVTLQRFGWFGIWIWIWMNVSSRIAWSTAVIPTHWVLRQVPGGPWKHFNFALLNLSNKKTILMIYSVPYKKYKLLCESVFHYKAVGVQKNKRLRKLYTI